MAVPSITQRYKVDIGLVGQTVNNSNVTGRYFDMAGFRKAVAVLVDGASAVNKATKIEWLQATDLSGTGAKVVKQSNLTTGTESSATSEAAAAAVNKVTKATLTLSGAANGETVTINGVTFTAHTDTTTPNLRQFSIAGTDTQDAEALAGLINNATYGVPGVTAAADTGVITLTVTDPGTRTITISTSAVSHFIPAIVEQLLYSEIDIDDLDIAGGFQYVAPKVTKAGNGVIACVIIREVGNYTPVSQQAAAGTNI